jgi:hypothetical protein
MKTTNLISKLNKLKIEHTIIDINGYNKDIVFVINGITFYAGFNTNKNVIEDYHREICYNVSEQEMQRRFFDNFNQLLRYAKA